MMKRGGLAVLLLIVFGLATPGGAMAVSLSPGGIGDVLIFQLIETNNLDTLIAIESFIQATALHRVRFRDAAIGAVALEFTLCLVPGETFTARVFRDGSLTKIESPAPHLINGVSSVLTTTLTGSPTRAFMEVIGLRAILGGTPNTTVCTDSTIGGDVPNAALMGKAYFVNGGQSPPLVYSANAVALKDFAAAKIDDGTVLQNNGVAEALIAQGAGTPGFQSVAFGTRYFVPASFDAVTQVVLTFPTGPTSGPCPSCRVPSNLSISPRTEPGVALTPIVLPADTSLVRVISLSSSDIANDAGVLAINDSQGFFPTPLVGFGINTTSTSASLFFNALFPLNIF
jgi:hypothetical protein